MILDQLVAVLEEEHTGGPEFFDALDTALLDPEICAAVYNQIKDPHRYSFILTGAFGRFFLKWLNKNSKPYAGYMLFTGGLRDGKVRSYEYYYFSIPDTWMLKACFVDDSIYSGITRATAIRQLAVPKILETYVAYDGMQEHQAWCHSLYRYHLRDTQPAVQEP